MSKNLQEGGVKNRHVSYVFVVETPLGCQLRYTTKYSSISLARFTSNTGIRILQRHCDDEYKYILIP